MKVSRQGRVFDKVKLCFMMLVRSGLISVNLTGDLTSAVLALHMKLTDQMSMMDTAFKSAA